MPPKPRAKKPPRQNISYDPESLGSSDRAYYREAWGFDPEVDRANFPTSEVGAGKILYRYEEWFPLPEDLPLAAAGVNVAARVDVVEDPDAEIRARHGPPESDFISENYEPLFSRARVVFRARADSAAGRGEKFEQGKEAAVECLHVVVARRHRKLARLPPWEHFAALKSWVAAVAEFGIGNVFNSAWNVPQAGGQFSESDTGEIPAMQPFGFNAAMQAQVLRAFFKVAPGASWAFLRDWMLFLLDSAPVDWLASRSELLRESFSHLHVRPPADVPTRIDCIKDTTLADILDRLTREMPPEWLEDHRSRVEALFGGPVFQMGSSTFVVQVGGTMLVAPGRGIASIPDLATAAGDVLAGVVELHLGNNLIEQIEGLDAFPCLRVLDLSWNPVAKGRKTAYFPLKIVPLRVNLIM